MTRDLQERLYAQRAALVMKKFKEGLSPEEDQTFKVLTDQLDQLQLEQEFSLVPVQGDSIWHLAPDHPAYRQFQDRYGREPMPPGFVAWDEHCAAHGGYEQKWGRGGQSAERLAERGGFSYEELCEFLGYAPKTWRTRK